MKLAFLALVLGLAPFRVTLGPVSLPVPWLLAAVEIVLVAGSIWLAARVIRQAWPRRYPAWSTGGAS